MQMARKISRHLLPRVDWLVCIIYRMWIWESLTLRNGFTSRGLAGYGPTVKLSFIYRAEDNANGISAGWLYLNQGAGQEKSIS